MAGERTPDYSPASKPGSSDDDISLREHLQRQLDLTAAMFNRRLEEQHQYFLALNEALALKLDERFVAQEKADRIAYEAHRAATNASFANAERAIAAATAATDKALSKVEHALADRFAAQNAALEKAERATEKRFESVNEFRQQLNDQAHTFMPRSESISRHDRTAEQLERIEKHTDTDIASINKRLDTMQGVIQGQQLQRNEGRQSFAAVYAFIGAAVAVLGAIIIIANIVSNGG